jgi:hypothetical protein
MSFTVDWHIPYRVVTVDVSGRLSNQDIKLYSDTVAQMLKDAESHLPGQPVYNVLDSTQLEIFPPLYHMIYYAIPVLRCKNLGPLYHVTQKHENRNLMQLTAHVMGFKIRTFALREEAVREVELAVTGEIWLP